MAQIIKDSFFYKNGKRRYQYLVVNKQTNDGYFVKEYSNSNTKYTEKDIIAMVNFLIDNIFVEFGGQIFQQTIGIPMGTNCAPLLADLFLYSYEANFIQNLLVHKKKNIAQSFNFTYRYIDDVLSLSNSNFDKYLNSIYPAELEIKNTTESTRSSSYLDLQLHIGADGPLFTKLFDKRDEFNFPIINFPFLDSNIPSSPAYGVYISQLIRYSRACSRYKDFLSRSKLLASKLLNQGYNVDKLKVATKKFCGRYYDLFNIFGITVSSFVNDLF